MNDPLVEQSPAALAGHDVRLNKAISNNININMFITVNIYMIIITITITSITSTSCVIITTIIAPSTGIRLPFHQL